MSWDSALVKYAQTEDPSTLGSSVYLTHDASTLTIFDKFPKANYHFLTLPRAKSESVPASLAELDSLTALARSKHALAVLQVLQKASEEVLEMIRMEMRDEHGREWPINVGFHSVESMKHVHLHIISSDLVSASLKNKKHYNSFNPDLGFFLHLSEVLRWAESGTLQERLPSPTAADKLLKGPLVSHHDHKEYKNIPTLKQHLLDTFEAAGKRVTSKRKSDVSEEKDKKKTRTD